MKWACGAESLVSRPDFMYSANCGTVMAAQKSAAMASDAIMPFLGHLLSFSLARRAFFLSRVVAREHSFNRINPNQDD